MGRFKSFEDAKAYIQSLEKIYTIKEWRQWIKSGAKPLDIPVCPDSVYAKNGWQGWKDFLGGRRSQPFEEKYIDLKARKFKSFEEAKIYIRSIGLKNIHEWWSWSKTEARPGNIPSNPRRVYAKDGWNGWPDFLGYESKYHNIQFKSLNESVSYVKTLGLKNCIEWRQWAKNGSRPEDIPSAPDVVYANDGWTCWADFLGSKKRYGRNHQFKTFEEARSYVRNLKLKNEDEWRQWVKNRTKPDDIPSNPQRVYADKGWCGWKNFLDYNNRYDEDHKFMSFEEAKNYIHKFDLNNSRDFFSWLKNNSMFDSIPSNPQKVYADKGWSGWQDFLGVNEKKFVSFEESKKYVQQLGLNCFKEWIIWAKSEKRPKNIPFRPNVLYSSKGWSNWKDFLGIDVNKYKSFDDAKIFVQKLNIKSYREWLIWARSDNRPKDIPYWPSQAYFDEWRGWGDFLGSVVFRTFEDAKEYVRSLKLKNCAAWLVWVKSNERPHDIPSSPNRFYAKCGWKGWGDFLGNDRANYFKGKNIRPFKEAREYVQSLNIESYSKWTRWVKSDSRPKDIPCNPSLSYKHEWKGWGDFLGNGRDKYCGIKDRKSFEEAKAYAQSLGIKIRAEWTRWAETDDRPKDIPFNPHVSYRNQWKGWSDFLGNNNKTNYCIVKNKKSFEEAKQYAQSLGIKVRAEWIRWAKTDARPNDIPFNPDVSYKDQWKGWGDFLGSTNSRIREFLPFEDARKYAQTLGIKSQMSWRQWAKTDQRPGNIPSRPEKFYVNKGWESWPDFLGYDDKFFKNRKLKSFEEARKYVQNVGLKNTRDWRKWVKTNEKPKDIPSNPDRTYANKGWQSWDDFLGNNSSNKSKNKLIR